MASCSFLRCTKTTQQDKHLSFHRFPLNKPKLCEKWIKIVNRPIRNGAPWRPNANSKICDIHFDPACISETKRLKVGSIPNPFDDYTDYILDETQLITCKSRCEGHHPDDLLKATVQSHLTDHTEDHPDDLLKATVQSHLTDHTEDHPHDLLKATVQSYLTDRTEAIVQSHLPDHEYTNTTVQDINSGHAEATLQSHLPVHINAVQGNTSGQIKKIDHATTTQELYDLVAKLRKEIRNKNQIIRRKDEKIVKLKSSLQKLIDEPKKEHCPLKPLAQELFKNETKNADRKEGRRYSRQMKAFAATLHFYSPQAYSFLSSIFSLPDQKTISAWNSKKYLCHQL